VPPRAGRRFDRGRAPGRSRIFSPFGAFFQAEKVRISAEKMRKKAEKMRLFAPESGLIKGLRAISAEKCFQPRLLYES
jgi:hypothetical protein